LARRVKLTLAAVGLAADLPALADSPVRARAVFPALELAVFPALEPAAVNQAARQLKARAAGSAALAELELPEAGRRPRRKCANVYRPCSAEGKSAN
jgi:hypothetical protein